MSDYQAFLRAKERVTKALGFEASDINSRLYPFQQDIVRWACRMGRAAIFADCGTGKTPMQLEFANQVRRHVGPSAAVLILAPLSVAQQTVREGQKFGIEARYLREDDDRPGIVVANYEMLEHFEVDRFAAVILDESSILKAQNGKTRNALIQACAQVPYRLACTATPAPNDFMELGNHCEFLGVMSRTEMLSMYFVHDGGSTQDWRIKGHAQKDFWRWVCGWAVMIRKPSDIGYEDGGFVLPPLNMHQHVIAADHSQAIHSGFLFAMEARTLSERRAAKRGTIDARVSACVDIINDSWIKNKNAPTTANIALPIWTESRRNGNSGTQLTQNASEQGRESTSQVLAKNKNTPHSAPTGNPTASTSVSTCAIAMRQSATPSSPITRGEEPSDHRWSKTGTSEQNTDLRSSSTTHCLPRKKADARYALKANQDDSRSTTITLRVESEDYSARDATMGSDISRTTEGYFEEQWLIWCNLNDEADAVARAIPGSVNVQGSDSREAKETAIAEFLSGKLRVLISKPSLFGFGLNLQVCSRVVFLGLSDSFEAFYQSIRRVWRFGQSRPVDCHVITSELEGAIVANIQRKEADLQLMVASMVEHMRSEMTANIKATRRQVVDYQPAVKMLVPSWIQSEVQP